MPRKKLRKKEAPVIVSSDDENTVSADEDESDGFLAHGSVGAASDAFALSDRSRSSSLALSNGGVGSVGRKKSRRRRSALQRSPPSSANSALRMALLKDRQQTSVLSRKIADEDRGKRKRCYVPLAFSLSVVTLCQISLALVVVLAVINASVTNSLNSLANNLLEVIENDTQRVVLSLENQVLSSAESFSTILSANTLPPEQADLPGTFTILKAILNTAPLVTNIYFGNDTGTFFMLGKAPVGNDQTFYKSYGDSALPTRLNRTAHAANPNVAFPDFDRVDNWILYDPRERPWYLPAVEQGRHWSQIYPFATRGSLGITFSVAIRHPENVEGQPQRSTSLRAVVGADITLASLSRFLLGLDILGGEGLAFIYSTDDPNYLVAGRTALDVGGLPIPVRESDNDLIRGISTALLLEDDNDVSVEQRQGLIGAHLKVYTVNGTDYVVRSRPLESREPSLPWQLVIVVPYDDVFGVIAEGQLYSTFILVIVIVISIVLASLLSCCFALPLHRLKDAMRMVATFDFSSAVLDTHSARKKDTDPDDGDDERRWNPVRFTSFFSEVRSLKDEFSVLQAGLVSFARFVPPEVVSRIVRGDPGADQLYVEPRVCSILFSDIVGFTSLSEKADELDLMIFLEEYFELCVRIIEEERGCIGDFFGDGIFCWFGSPDLLADHATHAVHCALRMQTAINDRCRHWRRTLGDRFGKIKIRIGIHTGNVLSGNVGAPSRMKFGLVGDAVNLASRLEGVNKVFGTRLIISEATFRAMDNEFAVKRSRSEDAESSGGSAGGSDGPVRSLFMPELAGEIQRRGSETGLSLQLVKDLITGGTPRTSSTYSGTSGGRGSVSGASSVSGKTVRNRAVTSSARLTSGPVSRRLATVIVKGKERKTCLHEVLCMASDPKAEYYKRLAQLYTDALDLFQSKEFLEAKNSLRRLLKSFPNDPPSLKLLERVEEAISNPSLFESTIKLDQK